MAQHSKQWGQRSASTLGLSAILVLAVAHWVLIGLATLGRFGLWPMCCRWSPSPSCLACVLSTFKTGHDRIVTVGLVLLGALLCSPPAEELFLSGDAAIYVNEAIFVARTGNLQHDARSAGRDPAVAHSFILLPRTYAINSVHAYAGMVYRSFAIDPATATIQISRMPLSTVWLARLCTGRSQNCPLQHAALCVLGVLLLYAVGRRLFGWPVALCCALLLAVSFMQIHFGRTSYAVTGNFGRWPACSPRWRGWNGGTRPCWQRRSAAG
ncbi:MAG: hypothetical protein R2932_38710 [Caldilineaceae bacterium]